MDFESELASECNKLVQRFEWYARELRDDDRRRTRRTGNSIRGTVLRPSYWSVDSAFNPYMVRSSLNSTARAVKIALREHDYRPFNPVEYEVPKSDKSMRKISVFSVADSVISRRIYRSLLYKNKTRLSAYSYAYRDDLTTHDAIQNIAADLHGKGRVFLAEYDFSKYFDSISQDYVWRILDAKRFLLSSLEKHVIHGFLTTSLQQEDSYIRRNIDISDTKEQARRKGIPQGTSISLFLANVAAWELDRSLERLGVGFARYADDTLIWSHDYGRICDAVESLTQLSADIGAPINFRKSEGISIFTALGTPAEFKSKPTVEFVGYKLDSDKIGMRNSVIERVKKRLAYIIWSNLLEPLRQGAFVPARVAPSVDRDYIVMILQIRRYLYGNLTEKKLRKLLDGRARQIRYPGLMSFFPLVDDIGQLKSMDGWLHHTVYTSLQARASLLKDLGVVSLPMPHGLSKNALLAATGKTSAGTSIDLRLPSFVRIGTAVQRASQAHGPNSIGRAGGPQHYDYT